MSRRHGLIDPWCFCHVVAVIGHLLPMVGLLALEGGCSSEGSCRGVAPAGGEAALRMGAPRMSGGAFSLGWVYSNSYGYIGFGRRCGSGIGIIISSTSSQM